MEIIIYQGPVKLFPPIGQHHRLMIASTIVPIIQCFQCSLTGLDQYLKAHPRLDASLLQCTLRSWLRHDGTWGRWLQPTKFKQQEPK